MPPKKSTPPCYDCGEPAEAAISQSEKNPNRPYFKCRPCGDKKGAKFLGWMDEYDGGPPQRKQFPQKRKKEDSEEEEESPPAKKKEKREDPSSSFLDKFVRDKILKNTENSEEVLSLIRQLNENFEALLALLTKGAEEEKK